MALGLSFIDVDVGKAAPLIGIAALGIAAWYIWNKSQQAQQTATQAPGNALVQYQAANDSAFLNSFTGGTSVPVSATNASGASTPVADPLLPTYSTPGNPAQNLTLPAPASQIGASTTSNGI